MLREPARVELKAQKKFVMERSVGSVTPPPPGLMNRMQAAEVSMGTRLWPVTHCAASRLEIGR